MSHSVQISPLQNRKGKDFPTEILFSSVVIREDHTNAGYMYEHNAEGILEMQSANDYQFEEFDPEIYLYDHVLERLRNPGINKPYKLPFDINSSNFFHEAKEIIDPECVINVNGEVAKNIYLLGDAAHGKTTYCLWLVNKWCMAQEGNDLENKEPDKWVEALQTFDFIFLLKFRNVNPNRVYVLDMICHDIFKRDIGCHSVIRHVLSSDKYKSGIIMDGLDEWNPNEQARKQLTHQGIPNIEGLSSTVTCLISMRPSVFPAISDIVEANDRVIEILGLSEFGMKGVIDDILLYHYNLVDDLSKYRDKYAEIQKYLKENSIRSFMKIPLLAVVCVQIWYEGKHVGDSLSSFYAVMIDMLIERANERQKIDENLKNDVDKIPAIFTENENIERFFSVLIKLGKVAFKDLISQETNLVFQKRKLEKEVGAKEIQFALDVGLISQREAPSLTKKNVSLNFFHKSIQEFLAAIYIGSCKEAGYSFCKDLSNVKAIKVLSNVIMFICGIYPSLGSVVSKQVVSVTDSDIDICNYRASPIALINRSLEKMYHEQLRWFKEFKNAIRDLKDEQTEYCMTFHVSDICLDSTTDKEKNDLTWELLSDHHVAIRSLYIRGDHTLVDSSTHLKLNNFLSNAETVVMLYISCSGIALNEICGPNIRSLDLQHLQINQSAVDCNVCTFFLKDMTKLNRLRLLNVNIGDRQIGITAGMVYLKDVYFSHVKMSKTGWKQFILSLSNVHHEIYIALISTNIDEDSKKLIRESSDFVVKGDGLVTGRLLDRFYGFVFTRVWPLDHSDL